MTTCFPRALAPALGALAFSLIAAPPLLAQAGYVVASGSTGPSESVLSLREMTVDVGIARGYARVNLRQVVENRTDNVLEGTWRFRLPPSGAVGDFAVWDGLVRIPGVIVEKRRARALYRNVTTQRVDPGLLQQGEEEDQPAGGRSGERPSSGSLFSVTIAPIPAYSTKRFECQYQHEVPWVDGVGELRIPLRPSEGEPMTAGELTVRVTLGDGTFQPVPADALAVSLDAGRAVATFSGKKVALARDLVLRFLPRAGAPLALSTFRSPDGRLPEGLALAPWERPSEIPPEKDGFFLLEYRPKLESKPAAPAEAARAPVTFAFLFDTSLSHRWNGLEAGYTFLVSLLDSLQARDRFVLVPFDSAAAPDPSGVQTVSPKARREALAYLRSRPLSPGTDVAGAVRSAAALLAAAGGGRLVLLTDGNEPVKALEAARAGLPLFTVLTGEERREGFAAASAGLLWSPALGRDESAEETLFRRRLFEPPPAAPKREAALRPGGPRDGASGAAASGPALPFAVSGGDPKLRDVYGVLAQPPAPGSLSGWIGRYERPAPAVTVALENGPSTSASFPERSLEARDLPRRWARARVDELLRRIEAEGERREWVDEILELSRRYKLVTPYTAFLAAPRSLLRPRRIQPGDPVIRVEADPATAAVTALLPFGASLALRRRAGTDLWEGRFLVPEGLPDGRIPVRLVLHDREGRAVAETKHLVLDGTPPTIEPRLPASARAGESVRVAARADADVLFLTARVGEGPPQPLRWDPQARTSSGVLDLPPGLHGRSTVFFEATDGAGNHGFARATLEVR